MSGTKMVVTTLTIMVNGALHVVLCQAPFTTEVLLATMADIVHGRVLLMLLKRAVVGEITIAAVTISHGEDANGITNRIESEERY